VRRDTKSCAAAAEITIESFRISFLILYILKIMLIELYERNSGKGVVIYFPFTGIGLK